MIWRCIQTASYLLLVRRQLGIATEGIVRDVKRVVEVCGRTVIATLDAKAESVSSRPAFCHLHEGVSDASLKVEVRHVSVYVPHVGRWTQSCVCLNQFL